MAEPRRIGLLTVLLPAYNAMPYLPAAVESILSQTYRDFELLIIDDGSSDGTPGYLDGLVDARVRVIHQDNRGLVETLNRGLVDARHDWVARMDGDDVALPERLARQVEFLERNPEYALVSCANGYVGNAGRRIRAEQRPHLAKPPKYDPRIGTIILHQGAVYDRRAVLDAGGYRNIVAAEDLDLWFRMAERHSLASIDDVLMLVRVLPKGISSSNLILQRVNWAYARACAEARRAGLSEPVNDAYLREHWPRGRARLGIEAARHIRMGGAAWANGKPLATAWHLGLAAALSPRQLAAKLVGYWRGPR